jgi:hypothetical protein
MQIAPSFASADHPSFGLAARTGGKVIVRTVGWIRRIVIVLSSPIRRSVAVTGRETSTNCSHSFAGDDWRPGYYLLDMSPAQVAEILGSPAPALTLQ